MSLPVYECHPEKERLVRTFHPWVFSGAVKLAAGNPAGKPGGKPEDKTKGQASSPPTASIPTGTRDPLPHIARLQTAGGEFLAWAQVNPGSKIRLRLCSRDALRVPDQAWLAERLAEAFGLRSRLSGQTDACRMVFGEGDGIPGLVIDRFGKWLVVQLETAGADSWRPALQAVLPKLATGCIRGLAGILEHSDSDGRRLEGLEEHHETWWGTAPDGPVEIHEGGVSLLVSPGSQKTGFYADQRDNRLRCAGFASGQDVLDVCCYTGGFSAHALAGGARSLTLVDASKDALELARTNLERLAMQASITQSPPPPQNRSPDPTDSGQNSVSPALLLDFIQGDAWETLRKLRKEGRRFGLVILDPPKLAPTRQSLDKAMKAYKDLNLQGMNLVAPGGVLASFSCSGLVLPEDFQTTLAWAAKDAGLRFQVIGRLEQGMDHPVPLHFPESRYLKGLLLRRME